MLRWFLSLLCLGLFIAGCGEAAPRGTPRFAIFLVDESVDDGQAPPDAGRFVADARMIAAAGGQPAVEFTLTPEGRGRFAALTRLNVGRRVAVVVNGAVVVSSIIGAEMLDGRAMLSGNYTEAQANALAAELIATATP